MVRDRAAYEELVDYLDKTISISKINYNPALGVYQLSEKELDALNTQKTVRLCIKVEFSELYHVICILKIVEGDMFYYFSLF